MYDHMHTHDMMLAGRYGSTNQIIGLESCPAVTHSIHSELQLLTDRQSGQLLTEITVI